MVILSHYNNGDIMEELVWEIFKKTGDIRYYLLTKNLEGDINANKKSRGNSNKRNKL